MSQFSLNPVISFGVKQTATTSCLLCLDHWAVSPGPCFGWVKIPKPFNHWCLWRLSLVFGMRNYSYIILPLRLDHLVSQSWSALPASSPALHCGTTGQGGGGAARVVSLQAWWGWGLPDAATCWVMEFVEPEHFSMAGVSSEPAHWIPAAAEALVLHGLPARRKHTHSSNLSHRVSNQSRRLASTTGPPGESVRVFRWRRQKGHREEWGWRSVRW